MRVSLHHTEAPLVLKVPSNDRFNLNTSASEIMINERSDRSIVEFTGVRTHWMVPFNRQYVRMNDSYSVDCHSCLRYELRW